MCMRDDLQAVEGMLLAEREERFAEQHDHTSLLLAMRVRVRLAGGLDECMRCVPVNKT